MPTLGVQHWRGLGCDFGHALAGEWMPLPDLPPCGCVFLPRGNPVLRPGQSWGTWALQSPGTSTKLVHTDPAESKRFKKATKTPSESQDVSGLLGVTT